MMKYNIISTGSKGNATIINDWILIDCGVSFRALREVYANLKIVLLTHIHSDHFRKSTICRLAKNRPTLRFACGGWLVQGLIDCGVNKKNIDVLEAGKQYDYGLLSVSPVKLYHDVPNYGYRVFINGKKLFYATDTNTLEGITAKGYDLYMVEANYEDEDIWNRIQKKRENGEYVYETGVLHTHLSRKKCDDFIYANIEPGGEYIYMHQHEDQGDKKCSCPQDTSRQ